MLNFREFLYLEEAFRVTLYHGTPLNNLSSILQKGLALKAPATWEQGHSVNYGTRAVYLTPDIELAARYAVAARKQETPVVLEIDLSSAKRFKKMSYDPMDREEDAWNDDGNWDDSRNEEIDDLERTISGLVRKYSSKGWYSVSLPDYVQEHGVLSLNGFNLYSFVNKLIWQELGDAEYRSQHQEIKRNIRQTFPTGDLSPLLSVTPSGTIRVRPQAYGQHGQLQYFRSVPPSAIRFVWVRQSDFPTARGETQNFGLKHLPHESKDMIESVQRMYERMSEALEKLSSDLDDVEYVKGELQDYIKEILEDDWEADESHELVTQLENILSMLDQEIDADEIAAELDQAAEIARTYSDVGHENWGQSIITNTTTWVRVPATQMQQIMNQKKAV